ncbi:hypothetical protein Tco_1283199 [Tanacetum coccineum]
MSMTIQSSVKDKILATSSETSKVENAPAEMLRDLDQQMEKRADDGKANVVTDALSRKERVKPRRVRAMAMTIQYGVRGMILTAQSEAFKQDNVPWVGSERDEAHASRSPVIWVEIRKSSLTGLELVQEITDKVIVRGGRSCVVKGVAIEGRNAFWKEGLRLPKEMSCVHDTFHVSNKKTMFGVPLDEIKVDKTLRFVEEPVENSDREVKRLKCSRMVVVKGSLGVLAKVSRADSSKTSGFVTTYNLVSRQFLFDELRYRVVNGVVTQLKVLTSLLDDGQGSGSWMFLFVWSSYAAMRTLLWAGKVVSLRLLSVVIWDRMSTPTQCCDMGSNGSGGHQRSLPKTEGCLVFLKKLDFVGLTTLQGDQDQEHTKFDLDKRHSNDIDNRTDLLITGMLELDFYETGCKAGVSLYLVRWKHGIPFVNARHPAVVVETLPFKELPLLYLNVCEQTLKLLMKNSPHLEITISSVASYLEVLSLDVDRELEDIKGEEIPKLPNVKILKLTLPTQEKGSLMASIGIATKCLKLKTFIASVCRYIDMN